LSKEEWALSVFTPDPKYKEEWPKWNYVCCIKNRENGSINFIPMFSFSAKRALEQAENYARFTTGELVGLKLLGPISWEGFNHPWVRYSNANKKYRDSLKG